MKIRLANHQTRAARLALPLISCLAAVLPTQDGFAQPPATFPVIVVLHDEVPVEGFRAAYRDDARAQANPAAWNYLDRGVAGLVQAFEAQHGFRAEHIYSRALRGFAGRLTARQIDALEQDPAVDYVEADGTMTVVAQTLPWGIDRIDADISSTVAGNGAGAIRNVNVYIIDTGVWDHPDLNLAGHVNFTGDGRYYDCNGHGTHVAGTVATKDNGRDVVGVVPGAPVTGLKVLNCHGNGPTSNVIKAVDWVTSNANKPAVAAGNESTDACTRSPARAGIHDGIMTVAATDASDQEPSWSNTGACVDIWAPGVLIESIVVDRRGRLSVQKWSGTSMAAPHAAGTGALYLSSHTGATAASVETQLKLDTVVTGTTSRIGVPIELVYAGKY